MSKSVLKGINSSWKKIEDSAVETKKKLKGFRKLIPSMGNLSSSHNRHQHLIDHENKHSFELLSKLNELRKDGTLCDLTFTSEECLKAHSAVVSFHRPLYELANTLDETVTVHIENADTKQSCEEAETVQEEPEDDGLVSHLQTDQLNLENDEKKISAENKVDNETQITNQGEEGTKAEETEVAENESDELVNENKLSDGETECDVSPPLAAELSSPTNSCVEDERGNKEETKSDNGLEMSVTPAIEDPVEILINFLYTSNIDITKTNVGKLRDLATRCEMNDIVEACNEFNKVVTAEIQDLATDEEMEITSAHFRYRYSDPVLPSKILKHLNALRTSKEHIDVTVVNSTGKMRYDAHACVLACASHFFGPLLSPTEKDNAEFEISDIDEEILTALLDYIYTGRISVTSHTVSNLLKASIELQIIAITEECVAFLKSMKNVGTCIQHLQLAKDYKQDELKNALLKFIATNINEVVRTPDFMALSIENLVEILTSNELELEVPISMGEMAVFKAAKKWIIHDEINRKQHLEKVMSCVRFPLIGERELVDKVTTDVMVMGNEELCKYITEVIASKPLHLFPKPVQMRGSEYILTLGGSYAVDDVTSKEQGYTAVAYDNHFTLFDPASGQSHELALMSETRSLHCVVACEQFVFVVGGFDSFSCIVNSVYCFDLSTGSWHEMASMRTKRACFSLHVLSGFIYAVGGLTPNGYTTSVERFDRRSKKWEFVSPLQETKYRHAGCVLEGNIVITGGHSKKISAFSYNPGNKEWKKLPPMNQGRDSHVMLEVKNKAYVLGGDDIAFSMEVYENGVWSMIKPDGIGQLFLPGATTVGDYIYLMGGWEKENIISPYIISIDTETWEVNDNHMMAIPRGSASSCTIRIPKNYWKTKFSTKMTTI